MTIPVILPLNAKKTFSERQGILEVFYFLHYIHLYYITLVFGLEIFFKNNLRNNLKNKIMQ